MIDYQLAINRKSKSSSKIPNIIKILNLKNENINRKSNDNNSMGYTFSNSIIKTHREYSNTLSGENSHRLCKNYSNNNQFKALKSSIFSELKNDTLNSGIFSSIPHGDKKLIDINNFNYLNKILDNTRFNSLYNTKLSSKDEYFVCYRTDTKFKSNSIFNKKSKSLMSLNLDSVKKIQLMVEADKRLQRLSNVPIKYPKLIKVDKKLNELKKIKTKNNKYVTKYKNKRNNEF